MIDSESVRHGTSRILELEGPLLSLYLVADPDPAAQRGLLLRAAAAVEEAGADEEQARRALSAVESDRRFGTLALFAGDGFLETFQVDAALPIGSAATGHVEAYWGEPYVAPLALALDRRRRHAVICMDSRQIRAYEVFLGAIEPMLDRECERPPDLEDSFVAARQGRPAYAASRDGAARDRAERYRAQWRAGFYRRVGAEIRAALFEREIGSVILTGPDKDVAAFLEASPATIGDRVMSRMPACAHSGASPAEVLAHVRATVATVNEERDRALVERITEYGITGVGQTLEALQRGQLSTVVASWQLDLSLATDPASGQIRVELTAPEGQLDERSVRLVLPRLAVERRTQLVFLPGAAGERLLEEHGGLGGVRRWR